MCASYAARNVTVLDASRGNTMHSLQNTFSGCGAITGNPERARPGVRNDLNPVPAQSKAAGEAQGVGAGDKKAIVLIDERRARKALSTLDANLDIVSTRATEVLAGLHAPEHRGCSSINLMSAPPQPTGLTRTLGPCAAVRVRPAPSDGRIMPH